MYEKKTEIVQRRNAVGFLDGRVSVFWAFMRVCLCVMWMGGWGGTVCAQTISRGPYLQQNTPEGVIIVWRTAQASTAQVRYGLSPQVLGSVVTSNVAKIQHEVRLTGLRPDTLYYYAVGTADRVLVGGDAQHFFRTSPTHGQVKKMRLWVVGDSGTGGTAQQEVRDAMLRYVGQRPPDLFLHMGDIAYNSGTDDEFQRHFFDIYRDILRVTPCWPTLGNHEGQNSDSATQTGPYYDAYVLPKGAEAGGVASGTEAYYSFDYGHVHFIVLDSHDSSRSVTGPMLIWLKADLAATKQPWLVAYWHHPPYSKGSHDSDTESQLREMRERALPILEAAGVDLVMAGHSHIYERSYLLHGAYDTPTTATGKIVDNGDGKLDGTGPYQKTVVGAKGAVYVVAGHGGASLSQGPRPHPVMYITEKANGSCLLDISETALTLTNIRRDGVVSDRFTLVKGEGIFWITPMGGESWVPGQTVKLLWRRVGSPLSQVTLRYSLDGGATWKDIVRNWPNNGSYDWQIPQTPSERVLLRVESAVDAKVYDETHGYSKITAEIQAIRWGEEWRYHASGQDQGATWMTQLFDDSGWSRGKAQLGYGDGDEATQIPHPSPTPPSVYFRKRFSLPLAVKSAQLQVLHDDGVIVWINGVRVFSKYADKGDGYAVWASSSSQENERSSATLDATARAALRVGENVIAVMIKQSSASSSDVSFDLSLDAVLDLPVVSEPTTEPTPEPTPEASVEPVPETTNEASFEPVVSEPSVEQAEQDGGVEKAEEQGIFETVVIPETTREPTEGVLSLESDGRTGGCAGCLVGNGVGDLWVGLCLLILWALGRSVVRRRRWSLR